MNKNCALPMMTVTLVRLPSLYAVGLVIKTHPSFFLLVAFDYATRVGHGQ